MGVAQNALLGALGTTTAAVAAAAKVGADMEKAEAAKAGEAESIQKDYLMNKEAMQHNEVEIEHLEKESNFKPGRGPNDAEGNPTGRKMSDIQAAKVALQQMQEKQQAIAEVRARQAMQYQKLTGKTIIGGDK